MAVTYKVVHGEGDIVQDLDQQLFPYQGSNVSVPFSQSLATGDSANTNRPRSEKRTVTDHYSVDSPMKEVGRTLHVIQNTQ